MCLLATEVHGTTWPFRHTPVGRRGTRRMNVCNRCTISPLLKTIELWRKRVRVELEAISRRLSREPKS